MKTRLGQRTIQDIDTRLEVCGKFQAAMRRVKRVRTWIRRWTCVGLMNTTKDQKQIPGDSSTIPFFAFQGGPKSNPWLSWKPGLGEKSCVCPEAGSREHAILCA